MAYKFVKFSQEEKGLRFSPFSTFNIYPFHGKLRKEERKRGRERKKKRERKREEGR